ncbi:MAG: hypothetical protein EA379_12325 [Phycisphaerales bacterium]|nr:MAG: hypothetical protein EA379_12325 [Phycisphaerales bacterium]
MPADLKAILKLEVPIIVQLAEREMTVGAVVSLTPGAIIELPKFAEEELDLLVNNKRIGVGVAVKVGENFGIRISHIGDVRERIQALAGAEAKAAAESREEHAIGGDAEGEGGARPARDAAGAAGRGQTRRGAADAA